MDTGKERLKEIENITNILGCSKGLYCCVCSQGDGSGSCADCKTARRIYDAGYRRTCETNTMTPEAYEKLVDGVMKLYEKNKQLKRKCRKLRKENKRLKAVKSDNLILQKIKKERNDYYKLRYNLEVSDDEEPHCFTTVDMITVVAKVLDRIIKEVEKPQ